MSGQSALDKAIAYMRERKAFGRRIADFQALQFRVADIDGLAAFRRKLASALPARRSFRTVRTHSRQARRISAARSTGKASIPA